MSFCKRCRMISILIFTSVIWLQMGLVGANPMVETPWNIEPSAAADTSDPEEVLTAQMEDMQRNSTKVAYQLASPANRRYTAAPDGYNKELFDSMVRGNAYKPLVSGYGYTVGDKGYLNMERTEYYADVTVYASRNRMSAVTYRFTMSIQPSNVIDRHASLGPYKMAPEHGPVWRTNSVLIRYYEGA